jgi:perosamine synthetase
MKNYFLNIPNLSGLEKRYLLEAFNSSWLSSGGINTKIFEKKFSKLVNQKFSVAVQSGTAALHATLKGIGVRKGDKVITPIYSCVASISSILQCNAIPIAVDIELDTLGLDINLVKKAVTKHRPKVLQLVHVYGFPARDSLEIIDFCKKNGVLVVEDGSEALGAKLYDYKIGQLGDVSIFSIRSEKMIGVGEGGVICTNNSKYFQKILLYCSRSTPFRGSKDPYWKKYYSIGEGCNYLMPHLLGSLARAQVERFRTIVGKKVKVGNIYKDIFKENSYFKLTQKILKGSKPVFWLNSILFKNVNKDKVIKIGNYLRKNGIEIRSGFWPLSNLKGFKPLIFENGNSKKIFEQSLVLPSSWNLNKTNVQFIYKKLLSFFNKNK